MVLDDIFSDSSAETRPASSEYSSRSEAIGENLAAPIDRLAATTVDFILAVPVISLVIAPLSRRAKEAQVLGADEAWLMNVTSAIALGAFSLIIFQTIAIAIFGATPGKHVLKLRVVSMWTGERPPLLESFARALVWCLELGFLGIPFLSVFSNHRRRPFHDRIADTAVISLAKTRRTGPADLTEMSLYSGFQAACLAVVLFAVSANFMHYQRQHDVTLEATLQREDDGRLCPEIREAIHESSGRRAGQTKDRLEVALMLFNSRSIPSRCLDAEAEFALWQSHPLPLAYLAKGLAILERDEDAGRIYLEKVCEKAQENVAEFADACSMSTLVRAGLASSTEGTLEGDASEAKISRVGRESEVEAVLSTISVESKTYLKIAAIRNMVANGEDARALSILDGLSEPKGFGAFIAGERAKALWRLGRKSEALAALRAVTALSSRLTRVEMARWFCYNETEFGRCGEGQIAACSELKAVIDGDMSILKKPDVAVAYVRAESCAVEKPDWRGLATRIPLDEAREYLESLALLAEGDIEAGIAKLRSVADRSEAQPHSFVIEANTKLIDRTESREELEEFKSKWERLQTSAPEWRVVGRHLLRRLNHLGGFDDAINIGLRMVKNDPGDRETYKMMILAAKNSGKLQMALGLLAQIPGRKPAGEAREESP